MAGDVFVIGAGPAGLTAAYLLTKQGVPTTVIEQDERYVGGISRTETYKGFLFDIGGTPLCPGAENYPQFPTAGSARGPEPTS